MKIKECCKIISQECIAKDIYSMWISTEAIAKEAKPGQFISVYTKDAGKLLPRPISLCEIDRENRLPNRRRRNPGIFQTSLRGFD